MKYQIAEYVIDTVRYRISSGDVVIPAEPKVFDLLVYLIRHRDRVLSREELFREVWEGREVSDATLSNHVKSARKVLGDSGELQKTILTIRGRGYQFIAPVTVIPEGVESAADKAPELQPAPARVVQPVVPVRRLPLVIVGVALVAALLGWYSFASLVVWDKNYQGRTDDTNLFAMQSAIAAAVSESLKVAILADERRALDEFPTTNLKAYESYVAGRYQLDLLSHESLPQAIELFEQAIAADPKFFDAYIARSDAYRQLFGYFEPRISASATPSAP